MILLSQMFTEVATKPGAPKEKARAEQRQT
jgi:hypothetical protein